MVNLRLSQVVASTMVHASGECDQTLTTPPRLSELRGNRGDPGRARVAESNVPLERRRATEPHCEPTSPMSHRSLVNTADGANESLATIVDSMCMPIALGV